MKKLICLCLLFTLFACTSEEKSESVGAQEPQGEESDKPKEDIRISFLAVGDNLIHNSVYLDPYRKIEGNWDYSATYEMISPYLKDVDIKNINQETPLGGRALGLSNYPMFNGPHEIGQAIVETGFNWISQASNHSIDAGVEGIMNQMNFWDQYQDQITTTGMNRSQAEADELRIIEAKGMKVGVLNYTYGLNGLSLPTDSQYMVNLIDEDKIKRDIAKLKGNCDVMVASMHWGEEYQFVPNDTQKKLAQMLSDEGVSVIIGAHPHVIQPMEYITSKTGEKTLVMYSLGNFISAQNVNYAMLGGMGTWEIVKNGETGKISIEQAKFYPLVTHFNAQMEDFKSYALKDYNDNLAQLHYLRSDISRNYFIELTNEILGNPENIEIVY